jgi:hypothetical protein
MPQAETADQPHLEGVPMPQGVSVGESFGPQAIGTTSAPMSYTFTFSKVTTLNAKTPYQVLTQGAADQDFIVSTGLTDCSGVILASPANCSVIVEFAPKAAGQRNGAIVLYGESGDVLATTYISGVGTGPQVAFDPGTPAADFHPPQLNWGTLSFGPAHIAVDGAGNSYVGAKDGQGTYAIYRFNQAGGYATILSGQSGAIGFMTFDGAGNLYFVLFSDTAPTQSVMKLVGGKPVPIITGLNSATGLAVDSSGNVYVAQAGAALAGSIFKYDAVTGKVSELPILEVGGQALSDPLGIAVDGSGNLLVNDEEKSSIIKIPPHGLPSSIYKYPQGTQIVQIALGGNGDLYFEELSTPGTIMKLTPGGDLITVLTGDVLGNPLAPLDFAVDGSGNLYIVSSAGQDVLFINRTTDTLQFGDVNVNLGSTADLQTFTVENIGNETLDFAVGVNKSGVGHNAYTLPAAYTLSAADTCQIGYVRNAINPKYSLVADSTCVVGLDFDPTAPGLDIGSMTIADNALNNTASEQKIQLNGNGNAEMTLVGCPPNGSGVPECTVTYTGNPFTITATTVPAGLPVTVTYNGSTKQPVYAGTYQVVATVTGGTVYTGSITGTLIIKPAAPVLAWPALAPIVYPTPFGTAQENATANVPGFWEYQYIPAGSTDQEPLTVPEVLSATPPGSPYMLYAYFTPTDKLDYETGLLIKNQLTVNPAPWNPGPLNIGNVIIGTTSPATSTKFLNSGETPVNCTSVTFTSGGSPVTGLSSLGLTMAITASFGTTTALPPTAACTYTFSYTPAAVTSLSLTMTLAGVPIPPLTITGAGVPPPIMLSPTTVNFGTIAQGSTNTQTVTLTNTTSSTIKGITQAINAGTTAYYILQPAPATTCTGPNNTVTLAANSSCVYSIQYAPTATTPNVNSALSVVAPWPYTTIEGGFPSWDASATLQGRNLTPAQAVWSPTSPLIAAVVGREGGIGITLTNNGGATLTGMVWASSANFLTGSGASAFTLSHYSCNNVTPATPPTSLPGGAQCVFSYELPATTPAGVYQATLSIGSDIGPVATTITGVIYAPPTLTPENSGSIFTDIPLNTSSPPLVLTLSNPTIGPVTISSASIVPNPANAASAADYRITANTCGTTLPAPAAGQQATTCAYTIVFTPTSELDGEYIPTFVVNTTFSAPSPVGSLPLALSSILAGTVQPVPALKVTPASLSFNPQTIGTVSSAQSITLTNTASGSVVTLSAPAFSGTGASDFQYTVSCTAKTVNSLGAGTLPGGNGEVCTYQVSLEPVGVVTGPLNVTMTIGTNAPTGNITIPITGTAEAQHTGLVVWSPDYVGQQLHVEEGIGATVTNITVQLPTTCNPTSVTANQAYAFVFCSSAAGHTDELLAYDANVIRNSQAGPITPAPLQTWVHGPSQLEGVQISTGAFDTAGNLWYSSNQNPALYEILASNIPDGALTQYLDTPGILVPVGLAAFNLGVDHISTIYPTGMAFAGDGSLWIGGSEYSANSVPTSSSVYGILLNIPASQLSGSGTKSFTCLTSDPNATKCSTYTGAFNDPGGVAIFNNMLWVSVTGAAQFGVTTAQPGREIVGFPLTLAPTGDTLGSPVTFGSAATPSASPFVCPGGLYGTAAHLWISDDGVGDSNATPTCGGTGDTAPDTGGIFDYTAAQLTSHAATGVLAYPNVTGRPGPGGIFVENDQ